MIIALAKHKTLCCLIFNDGCAGIRANTPESMEDPERHASPPSEAPERSPEPVEEGRQRAAAAVQTMHPPSFLAKMSASLTQEKTSNIISDVRSLYVVPDGDQAPGVDSDGYRVGLKRKAAGISRSQYEVYSFSTKHNLSEAAVDELLGMLGNVSTL